MGEWVHFIVGEKDNNSILFTVHSLILWVCISFTCRVMRSGLFKWSRRFAGATIFGSCRFIRLMKEASMGCPAWNIFFPAHIQIAYTHCNQFLSHKDRKALNPRTMWLIGILATIAFNGKGRLLPLLRELPNLNLR